MILAGSAFYISSKGLSVLYLFLLADLLCCAAAIPIFYGFYNRKINSENVFKSIIFGAHFFKLMAGAQNFLFQQKIFTKIFSSSSLKKEKNIWRILKKESRQLEFRR